MGELVAQSNTHEKVLTELAIWNSRPVMVHAVADVRALMVFRTPSSLDTVSVHASDVSAPAGTRYANEYQYVPLVAGEAKVWDNLAVSSSTLGAKRANPVPS
jgi:hypothetical protein